MNIALCGVYRDICVNSMEVEPITIVPIDVCDDDARYNTIIAEFTSITLIAFAMNICDKLYKKVLVVLD